MGADPLSFWNYNYLRSQFNGIVYKVIKLNKNKSLVKRLLNRKKLSSEQKPEECDATKDAQGLDAGKQILDRR